MSASRPDACGGAIAFSHRRNVRRVATLDAAPSTGYSGVVAVAVISRALATILELAGSTVVRAGACSHLDALCADAERGMALAHGVARDGCSADRRWARHLFAVGSECACPPMRHWNGKARMSAVPAGRAGSAPVGRKARGRHRGVNVETPSGRLGENVIGLSVRATVSRCGTFFAEPEFVDVGCDRPHGPSHRSLLVAAAARASTFASGEGGRELMAE
jgi:hypothetical protein